MATNKFIRSIAGSVDGIKLARVTVLATQASLAQEDLINTLKRKLSALDLQLTQLTDLAPDSADSLRPGNGFDPVQWVNAVQSLKVDMKKLSDQLAFAEETKAEWFATVNVAV
jgi:hypothetical protein